MSYFGDPGFSETSTGNSTTTPLAGDATFTGTGEQNDYPDVFVMLKSDADGTLYFDFSNDGTNWDSTYPVSGYDCNAGIPEVHVARKAGRYFRARYVNGSDAQTYFRMTVYYGQHGDLMASANQAVSRHGDAKVVRVYADPQDEIVLGQRSGVRHYTKFAYMPDLDTGDGAKLITADPAKPAVPEVLTSAETFDITFDDTNDGESTNGALTLFIDYINADGEETFSTHTLSGTSPDTTSFSGFGINRIAVASSGSTDTNFGAISVASTTTGGFHAHVPAGQGVTQQAVFHTPSNAQCVAKFLFGNAVKLSGGGNPLVTFRGWVHNRTVDTKFEVFRYSLDTQRGNDFQLVEPVGFRLSSGDILYFTASTDTSNTAINSFRFSLNEYENV